MRLKEFQKKLDEMWDRLEKRGVKIVKKLPEDSVEENTSEKKNTSKDKQVTMSAIFMPPRINRREKWLKDREKRLKDEENNNDSE